MNRLLVFPPLIFILIFMLESSFPYFKGRADHLGHALPNMFIAFIALLINLIIFILFTDKVIQWAEVNSFGALNLIKLPFGIKLIIAFFIFDLWMYVWHRANHRLPILWLLHRAHHNDTELDSTTALRFHPLEIIISSFLNIGVIAVFGLNIAQIIVYNVIFQPVIFFHHSNIGLPDRWDRRLRAIIVTPNMHRVHHSIETVETNSNYSSVFSFWDRLFRTFKKREDILNIVYGLNIFREKVWQGLIGFLAIPFQRT